MKVIRDSYLSKYQVQIEKDMETKVTGLFGRMLRVLLKVPRNDDQLMVDSDLADEHVKLISVRGVEAIGRDVDLFTELFAGHSWGQIAAFLQRFKMSDVRRKSLLSYIRQDKNLHADIQKMLLVIVKIAQNEQLYFAEQLYTAIFDGDGDHDTIIRIVVTRSEIDLADICEIYEDKYKRCLQTDISKKCSGDYAKLLSRLIKCTDKFDNHFNIIEVE
ncbi:unnamed protein product [Enterobius vermicularis]|uniref:Annexin n=1 Tax=Enterobius vermicularis TaxID=51028 RepID=A0A0N4VDV1_ENTVE|nr:unnamed protein product [Enterobius vermicularis]